MSSEPDFPELNAQGAQPEEFSSEPAEEPA